MACSTILMTVSMVAIASAGFPGWPANDSPFPGFVSPMMSSLRFGPIASPASTIPGMSTFPQNFPFFQFPVFPTMPTFPPIPSVADIATGVPTNGGSFTGVVISSKSEMKRKEDGTIVKEGGSTILTNTDGVISMKQTGNNPPPVPTNAPPEEDSTESDLSVTVTQNQPYNNENKNHCDFTSDAKSEFDFNDRKIKPSNLNQFKNFDHIKKIEDFNHFGFRNTFPAIDPKIIETYVPGEDEKFEGHSIRTHSFSSNNNGQIKEGGSLTKIDNDNGHVKKEKVAFNSDGTQP